MFFPTLKETYFENNLILYNLQVFPSSVIFIPAGQKHVRPPGRTTHIWEHSPLFWQAVWAADKVEMSLSEQSESSNIIEIIIISVT